MSKLLYDGTQWINLPSGSRYLWDEARVARAVKEFEDLTWGRGILVKVGKDDYDWRPYTRWERVKLVWKLLRTGKVWTNRSYT